MRAARELEDRGWRGYDPRAAVPAAAAAVALSAALLAGRWAVADAVTTLPDRLTTLAVYASVLAVWPVVLGLAVYRAVVRTYRLTDRAVLIDWGPFALPEPDLAAFRNRHVGFVFQDHHLLPQCSVLENILVPTLVAADGDRSAFEAEARRLAERVNLSARLDHRPAELSGGERQRAAIARALIRKPKLLLADEPTGNLDRKTAQSVGELLTSLHRQEGAILVVVTHSPELASLFPRRMEMNDGSLSPAEAAS